MVWFIPMSCGTITSYGKSKYCNPLSRGKSLGRSMEFECILHREIIHSMMDWDNSPEGYMCHNYSSFLFI